jgi:site-specific DNA-methyltransferase (adenine-specific)
VGNVIQCARTGNVNHTTEKPVDLLRTFLRVADFAQTVYDPFVGSGSTILAAEAEGRAARALEIEPDYVAATLERLKGAGLEPRLVPK